MPIIKSAIKRARQNKVIQERRRPFKTRMLTLYKNIRKYFEKGEKDKIASTFADTVKAIDTAAKKNIIHKNNAARKKASIQKMFNDAVGGKVSASQESSKKAESKTVAKKPAAKKTSAKKPATKAPAKKKAATPKKTAAKKA